MIPLILTAVLIPTDAEWPQFRGRDGQGVVNEPLAVEWDEAKNVSWFCAVPGVGHSSPVVWDDLAWMTTAAADGSTMSLVAVDLKSGRLEHNIELFRPDDIKEIHLDNSYASPTPCIDENRVYAHFGRYGTAAVDTATGQVVWQNTEVNVWHNSGPASSPVLAGGRLVLTFDAMEESFVCGLDPANGEMLWKTPRSAPLRKNPIMHRAFSTPYVLDAGGVDVCVIPGPDQMNCYVAESGNELWHVRFIGFSTVPSPTTDGERLFYCTGFADTELRALRLEGLLPPAIPVDVATSRDVTESHSVWSYDRSVSETPSPTYANGRVWIVSDKGVLTSVDAETGERLTVGRVRDNVSASPLLAGGRLYVFGESGFTTVWDIDAEKPEQLARNRMPAGIKASPAVVGSSLLLRTLDGLYRINRP